MDEEVRTMICFDKEARQAFRNRLGEFFTDPGAIDELVEMIAEKQKDGFGELRASQTVEDVNYNGGQLDLVDWLIGMVEQIGRERGITG